MNILILGGTGNISSETAQCFADLGRQVTVLTTGRTPAPDRFRHIIADRHCRPSLANALGKATFDIVVDFLGYTPEHCRIAYETLRGKTGHYIFISSATVYRKPHTVLPIHEDMPQGNLFSEYARQKIACESYLRTVQGADFPLTIIRPSHTFGKTWIPSPIHGSDWTVAARIISGKPVVVHDNGQSLWTLTASSDFAAALCGLAGNKQAIGEAFNITSDEHLTWNCIYREIGLALGHEPRIVHIPTPFLEQVMPSATEKLRGDKAEHGVFDCTKVKKLIPQWICRKTLRDAVRESVAWYREDTSRQSVDTKKDAAIDELIERWRTNGTHAVK